MSVIIYTWKWYACRYPQCEESDKCAVHYGRFFRKLNKQDEYDIITVIAFLQLVLLRNTTLLLLINAFVFSKLFYCLTVWSNTSKASVKRLQLVQNFAGRIVLGLKKYDHISEGLRSLKWLSVSDKLLLHDSIMVDKCMNGRDPGYLINKFTRRLEFHDKNARYNKDLNLPRCRFKTGQRSFAYRLKKPQRAS